MNSAAEAYPLTWPAGWRRSAQRKQARYKTTFGVARSDLENELRMLGATDVILSTNIPLKKNGDPYAVQNGRIDDPGVAVYFKRNGSQQVIASDKWLDVGDNLHAVGLAVSYLRGLDRTGASEILDRAFTGFKALPAAGGTSAPARPWWEVLDVKSTATKDEALSAYREKARQNHPDRGGKADVMATINVAWDQAQREISA